MTYTSIGSLTACCWLLAGGIVSGADWPQWRGPHRNGQSATRMALPNEPRFEEVWKTNVGIGFSSTAIVDDRVYTLGNRDNRDTIWCLDAGTGAVVWTREYEAALDPNLFEGGPTATPTVADGKVYTISRRGDVYCLAADTGQVLWHVNIVAKLNWNVPTWGFSGSPLVWEDRLLLNAGSHGLCLDASTGDILWSSDNSEDAGYSSPLIVQHDQKPLVLLLSAKSLHAVDARTGALCWSLPWITRYGINAADPIVIDHQHVLISSGYSKGTALVQYDDSAAELLWRSRSLRNQMAPGVVLDGHAFAIDGDDGSATELVCMQARTGDVTWRAGGFGSATLIAVGNRLCLLSQSGELVLADADVRTFEVVARQKIGEGKFWTPPAYALESFFIRNAQGDLFRIRISP